MSCQRTINASGSPSFAPRDRHLLGRRDIPALLEPEFADLAGLKGSQELRLAGNMHAATHGRRIVAMTGSHRNFAMEEEISSTIPSSSHSVPIRRSALSAPAQKLLAQRKALYC